MNRVVVVVHYLADQVEAYLRLARHFKQWLTVPKPSRRAPATIRGCREYLRSDHVLVLNGDDLGAADLAALAFHPAGLLVQGVDEPRRFGIAFSAADGTLEKLVECV